MTLPGSPYLIHSLGFNWALSSNKSLNLSRLSYSFRVKGIALLACFHFNSLVIPCYVLDVFKISKSVLCYLCLVHFSRRFGLLVAKKHCNFVKGIIQSGHLLDPLISDLIFISSLK